MNFILRFAIMAIWMFFLCAWGAPKWAGIGLAMVIAYVVLPEKASE